MQKIIWSPGMLYMYLGHVAAKTDGVASTHTKISGINSGCGVLRLQLF
ncbi:MAG: hypothetical protein PHH84_01435 [Oscillospiraceae bacterium]|nr:hypothetical protein [Oscillospiraceae bacterium]MDD4412963.1 hypothetical protein [Oscillospiraceae bacterium]